MAVEKTQSLQAETHSKHSSTQHAQTRQSVEMAEVDLRQELDLGVLPGDADADLAPEPVSRTSSGSETVEGQITVSQATAPPQSPGNLAENPFLRLDSPVTAYEVFKMAVLFPWTILRFILLITCLLITWFSCWLCLVGHDRSKPMPPGRGRISRCLLSFWSYTLLKVFYHFWWIKVIGKEHMVEAKKKRCILVINHTTYIDPIAMTAVLAPSAVANAGVATIPFFGTFAKTLQCLFVERKGFDNSHKAAVSKGGAQLLAERARDEKYPLVMVFPEGTTKGEPCMLRFSSGAFVAGQPVLPILMRYKWKHFNPGWGASDPLWHVFRLMNQFKNSLEIEICPPYIPSPAELADARVYADNVRSWMGAQLGAPLVDYGVQELAALYKAGIKISKSGRRIITPKTIDKQPLNLTSQPSDAIAVTVDGSVDASVGYKQ